MLSKDVISTQLHVFCDGSEAGYGAVAYIRVESKRQVNVTLILAKSRLAPLKKLTIPRLELAGAKLAVELASIVRREKSFNIDEEWFWTDSETVLKYLKNERKRFLRFVANRIEYIRDRSTVEQWNHVPGVINPADAASRGVPIREFVVNTIWKSDPKFLWQDKQFWPRGVTNCDIEDGDPEIARDLVISAATTLPMDNMVMGWFESVSNWDRLTKMVAGFLDFKNKLTKGASLGTCFVSISRAEDVIILQVQEAHMTSLRHKLLKGEELEQRNPFRKLSPFIDSDGLVRVGGRINLAKDVAYDRRHPIILPRGHISTILVRRAHILVGHLGKDAVLAKLRERFWIIGEVPLVKSVLRNCIHCKKYHGKVIEQYMSELPVDRLRSDLPPFSNTGVDLFGPFSVVRGRSSLERYGLVFTCLSSRAMHLEVVYDKSTDSFILALRRFIARRGMVQILRSDNGTNFVGADTELRKIAKSLDHSHIQEEMRGMNIEWIFNPPYAHHFGGVWEREIRSIRQVLSGLLSGQSRSLSDESLCTLLCEVEAILNSRPLTPVSSDPLDLEALTPNHLLLQRSGPTLPPGLFEKADVYSKRRWRQVQYLADLFWSRWRKEYLSRLLQRQKWNKTTRDVMVGDLVLLVQENVPRCRWPLARVIEVIPGEDKKIRQVRVKTSSGEYRRPVSHLVMLLENKEAGIENGQEPEDL